MIEHAFRPLVVGAPRSGFALLASVVIHFLPLIKRPVDQRQEILNILLRGLGDHVSACVVECFERHGITRDLLYNPNFRYLVGGPKWIPRERPDTACFRKYIGVRGMGDFTLVTAHPREVLNLDEIVHSHTDPALWLEHPGYADYTKFASIRNPVDILNSSVFSLNALASEYIQKFLPPEQDNDRIRQDLALYKFTDPDFFEGLVKFLAGYFDEFMAVRDRYILMRWEDLIQQPVPTILRLAEESGVPMTREYAANIWSKLDHVNLTQAHKHNYRVGHGVVGGWKNWITNHHLRMIKDYGFDKHMATLGYGEIEFLDESKYTPFQQKVSACIDAGEVHRDFFDPDLFTYAFNKSNLISDKFPFKRYGWRKNTQIERSIFTDEALQNDVWDCAEQACEELNALISDFLESSKDLTGKSWGRLLERLQTDHQPGLGHAMGNRYESAFQQAQAWAKQGEAPHGAIQKVRCMAGRVKRRVGRLVGQAVSAEAVAQPVEPPRLVAAEAACNVVEYRGQYFALPHALGPIEVDKQNVEHLSGVLVAASLERAIEYARQYGRDGMEITLKPETAGRRLVFFEPSMEEAARALVGLAGRRIVLHSWDEFAARLFAHVGNGNKVAVLASAPDGQSIPAGIESISKPEPGDALLLNEFDPEKLSSLLLDYLDVRDLVLVAPVTSHYCRNRPLFLISIPKAGTHLLYRLAEAFGYGAGVVHNGDPAPGNWYCVEYSNSHTVARDFFVDTVRRQPFGNRHHPFPRTPTLFIYRNPLDIVVSEANYYHRDDATVFSSYLRHLDFEKRLLRLIRDPYLLGSIRDRINNFVPWFDCENVIPVSFEELVGAKGGGDDAVRNRLIWALQLKLHIPGSPEAFGAAIFDEASPTFHEGRIGSWRNKMTPDALRQFFALDQDFMRLSGYLDGQVTGEEGDGQWEHICTIPLRAEEFRHRPLRTSKEDFCDTPIQVEWGFLGYNIVRFDKRYFAIPRFDKPVDLVALRSSGQLDELLSSNDIETLKAGIRTQSGRGHLGLRRLRFFEAKISLLMPTRARPIWAERFFKSVAENSTHMDQVEVILYVDEDDTGSHHLSSDEIRVERIIGPRMSMGSYNSACLEKARGDIVILVNDDMVIRTPGWDEKIRALDAGFPDGIYLAYGNDLFKGGKLCTFPILSRRACEALGDPYPAAYRGAFIDYHLFDVFQRLRHMGHDRIRYLEDVVFEHLHFRAGKAEKDATYTQRNRFGDDPIFVGLKEQRAIAAARLKNAIDGVVQEPAVRQDNEIDDQLSMVGLTRTFLLDRGLPLGWRFFLWYWFLGRYAASRGWLRPFVR